MIGRACSHYFRVTTLVDYSAAVPIFHYDASARQLSGRRFPTAAGFEGVVVASAQRMSQFSSVDAPSILKRHGDAVNENFKVLRDRYTSAPPRLIEAMEYSLMAGGKRLRPALVLECFAACSGGNDEGSG